MNGMGDGKRGLGGEIPTLHTHDCLFFLVFIV
jgi:hypothetical protein